MTHEEMERAIEFLLHQGGKFNADVGILEQKVDVLTDRLDRLVQTVDRMGHKVDRLADNVEAVTEGLDGLKQTVSSIIVEMRDSFNNLIVANEVSRDLASQAAKLAIATSQRVTKLEKE